MCRTLKSVSSCSFCLEGEMAMSAVIYQFMSCYQRLADDQGLRRNMIRKSQNLRKRYVKDLSEWAKK